MPELPEIETMRRGLLPTIGGIVTAINGEGNYQSQHRVYDRADKTCQTCRKRVIERIVQAQRGTFYCPKCQVKY